MSTVKIVYIANLYVSSNTIIINFNMQPLPPPIDPYFQTLFQPQQSSSQEKSENSIKKIIQISYSRINIVSFVQHVIGVSPNTIIWVFVSCLLWSFYFFSLCLFLHTSLTTQSGKSWR